MYVMKLFEKGYSDCEHSSGELLCLGMEKGGERNVVLGHAQWPWQSGS